MCDILGFTSCFGLEGISSSCSRRLRSNRNGKKKKTTSKLNVAGIFRRSPLSIQEKCPFCMRISQFYNHHQNSYQRFATLQESLASVVPGEWASCQQGFQSHQWILLRTPEHIFLWSQNQETSPASQKWLYITGSRTISICDRSDNKTVFQAVFPFLNVFFMALRHERRNVLS